MDDTPSPAFRETDHYGRTIQRLQQDLTAANEREARLRVALSHSTDHLEIMISPDDRIGPTIIAQNRWLLKLTVPEATAERSAATTEGG